MGVAAQVLTLLNRERGLEYGKLFEIGLKNINLKFETAKLPRTNGRGTPIQLS